MSTAVTEITPDKTAEGAGNKSPDGKDDGKGTDTSNQDAPKFTQKDQDALAQKIRREEKDKHEKKAAEEKRLAEDAKAKEQGEFQKLADSRQKELDELKPKHEAATQELETYKAKVAEMVAADLKALPDEVREISPAQYGEDKALTNPLDVLAWLPKGKVLAEKLEGQPAKPGTKSDPKVKGAPGEVEKDKQAQSAMASRYSRW